MVSQGGVRSAIFRRLAPMTVVVLVLCLMGTSRPISAFVLSQTNARVYIPSLSSQQNNGLDAKDDGEHPMYPLADLPNESDSVSRRSFFCHSLLIPSAATLISKPQSAQAAGLVQFPQAKPFLNTYHLLRVGTTMLEEEDIWSTNPLFLTNREDALSPTGQDQILASCQELKRTTPTVIKHSLAAACVDTANVVQRELNLGRDRLFAEFVFLDPRGLGAWDNLSKSRVSPAVWAMDEDEAGATGLGARPPPNEDGTPHEVLADQTIRLRQLLSSLESQYSGDTILLVFPDGTGPAVLSCMIAGLPLNKAHILEFAEGELRTDVRIETVKALWDATLADEAKMEAYKETIAKGRTTLKELRSKETFVSRKDELLEERRRAIDETYEQQQAEKRLAEAEKVKEQKAIQQEMQSKKEASKMEGDGGILDDSLPVGALAGASFAAVAGAALLGGEEPGISSNATVESIPLNSSATVPNPVPSTTKTSQSNSSESPSLSSYFGSNTNTETNNAIENASKSNSTDVTVEAANSDSASVQVAVQQRVNGSSKNTFLEQWPKPTPVDPYAAAKKAMDDYLESDDGGDACRLILCIWA